MTNEGSHPRVAVVVPARNAADTLPMLLDAFARQTLADFVVLFVDDGSTDGTARIAAAAQDARISVIAGAGEGPGPARNRALARVEALNPGYVAFCDADDRPFPEMLARAVALAESARADVVEWNWTDGDRPRIRAPFRDVVVWNKLYRAPFIRGIRFLASTMAEDLSFNLEVGARHPVYLRVDETLYEHRLREGSLWHGRPPESVLHSVDLVVSHFLDFYTTHPELSAERRAWVWRHQPILLKHARRALARFPEERRAAARAEYAGLVRRLRAAGVLRPNLSRLKDLKYWLRDEFDARWGKA